MDKTADKTMANAPANVPVVRKVARRETHFHAEPQIERTDFPHPQTGAPMVRLELSDHHHDVKDPAHEPTMVLVLPAASLQHPAFLGPALPASAPKAPEGRPVPARTANLSP